jgi:hypothetical protein
MVNSVPVANYLTIKLKAKIKNSGLESLTLPGESVKVSYTLVGRLCK